MMQLNAENSRTYLVGGYDERDDPQYKIHSRLDYYKKELVNSIQLFENKTVGTLQGEASSFFSISGKAGGNAWCQLSDVKMIFLPESAEALLSSLQDFLSSNNVSVQDIDILVSGVSGDVNNDKIIEQITQTDFSNIPEVRFKHLCGEYCTASSFGLWLGSSILKKQEIPAIVKFNKAKEKLPVKTVLVLNQYMGRNYSFILLRGI